MILDFGFDTVTQNMFIEKTLNMYFNEPKIVACIAQFLHGESSVKEHSSVLDLRWHYKNIVMPVYASFTLWSCRRVTMEINATQSEDRKNNYYQASNYINKSNNLQE